MNKNIRVDRVRLYPGKRSKALKMLHTMDTNRHVWNKARHHIKENNLDKKEDVKKLQSLQSSAFLTPLKNQPDGEWLCDYNSRTLGMNLKRLIDAQKEYINGIRKKPKYQEWGAVTSYDLDKLNSSISRDKNGNLILTESGTRKDPSQTKYRLKGKTKYVTSVDDGRYVGVVIKNEGRKFYANIRSDVDESEVKPGVKNGVVAGLDLNAKIHVMFSSKGEFTIYSRPSRKKGCKTIDIMNEQGKKLEKIQSKMDKKLDQEEIKKGSRLHDFTKNRIRKLHREIKNTRQTHNHNISRKAADKFQLIIAEQIDYAKMFANESGTVENPKSGRSQKTRIIREFSGAAPSQLRGYLADKVWKVIFVNPSMTSRKCPKCNHTSENNRRNQSSFICVKPKCGFSHNADMVAAFNIYNRGIGILKDLGRLRELEESRLIEILNTSEPLPVKRPLISRAEGDSDKVFKNKIIKKIKEVFGDKLNEMITIGNYCDYKKVVDFPDKNDILDNSRSVCN